MDFFFKVLSAKNSMINIKICSGPNLSLALYEKVKKCILSSRETVHLSVTFANPFYTWNIET